MTNLDRYRADRDALVALGEKMLEDFVSSDRKDFGTFEEEYQCWYTEASAVVRQLIPDRLAEFEQMYKGEGKRKAINGGTYTIQDWLNGIRAGTDIFTDQKDYDDHGIAVMRFNTQLAILKAASRRFESSLLDIRQLVQADLLDSELEEAGELVKHGFLRAAGAVAGVVLEKHLGQIAYNHDIQIRKKDPNIGDLNDLLKTNNVYDIATWRSIQRLGDLRNLCDHNKSREVTKIEVEELISGVEKVTKTLF